MDLNFREPLPPFSDWTIESELAEHLVSIIEHTKPKQIIECGSGLSTVIMAYALQKNGSGRVIALENNPRFANKTFHWLAEHDLRKWADIRHAPITRVRNPWDKMDYPWYDVPDDLSSKKFDFLLVDGPEHHVCHMARWPAIFVLGSMLEYDCTIVCDDTNRKHEAAMIEHWLEQVPDFTMEKLGTWRGATVLRRGNHADAKGKRARRADAEQEAAGGKELPPVRRDVEAGAEGRPDSVPQEA